MPHWRKATWALLIWTVVMIIWVVGGSMAAGNTACDPILSQATCDAAKAIGGGIGVTIIIIIWFIGFIVLGLIWLMSRPKDNVLVYGPQGQQVTVSEKEARRRVEKQGWSYTTRQEPPHSGSRRRLATVALVIALVVITVFRPEWNCSCCWDRGWARRCALRRPDRLHSPRRPLCVALIAGRRASGWLVAESSPPQRERASVLVSAR